MWKDILLVAAGGALGATARFAATTWLPRSQFGWATLSVNLAGSFALGALVLAGTSDSGRLLLGVGFLGGFTTLSAYSVETLDLARAKQYGMAGANVVANALGGPLMALAGWRLRVGLA